MFAKIIMLFRKVVWLSVLPVIFAAPAPSVDCTTYTTTEITTVETSYFVVNSVPARDTFNNSTYPIFSCENYFDTINEFSCHNTSAVPACESCCFEDYGILLQAQSWDYNPDYLSIAVNGTQQDKDAIEGNSTIMNPSDPAQRAFTIHGLWNDLCDGSYNQYCNPSLEISDAKDNITRVLVDEFGQKDLYDYMIKFWVNNVKSNVPNGGSISLWEHEYNKHGTCMNTLLPSCFTGEYTRFENTVYFYKKVVELYQNVQTQTFLAESGIVPTVTKQYRLSDVIDAIAKNNAGKQVYVGCLNGAIDEIWYYYNLKGNVLTGDYKPIELTTKQGCPQNVWYIPK